MAGWVINPDQNNGYPFYDGYFPTSFQTDFTGIFPITAWSIEDGQNNGYPFNGTFPASFQTEYYSDRDNPLPYGSWRVQGDVNNGYPYQDWVEWRDYTGSVGGDDNRGGGDMHIGGSRSNYPNGFSYANRGGVMSQFNKKSMINVHGQGSAAAIQQVQACMAARQFSLTGDDLAAVLTFINTNLSDSDLTKIQKIYGANIYDAFLVCKAYPFRIPAENGTSEMAFFGTIDVGDYHKATDMMIRFYMGSVEIDIKQAWELENIDYSIYLPFCGIFPLDVRNGLAIDVDCYIDLYHGTGEYHIHQDAQITAIYSFRIGIDIPLNFDQAIAHSNKISNIATTFLKGMTLAAGGVGALAGGVAGNPGIGAAIGAGVASITGGMIQDNFVSHLQTQSPQMGELTSIYSYPFVRVIAQAPYMWEDGYGYRETLGENRSKCFETLRTCKGGFIKTVNYKCDIIVATDEEKQEIERLMNGGVFL